MRELVQTPPGSHPAAIGAPPRPRRTQAERRETTRALLVSATIECLIEFGYAGTSTNEVLKRTGISRGALAHHYASKADLLLATMDQLYADFSASILAASRSLPSGRGRMEAGIEMLWERFTGPLFVAAMELWVAARTDDALRVALLPHEQRLGGQLRSLTTAVFGPEAAAHPSAEAVYHLLLTSMRGQALAYFLQPAAPRSGDHLQNWFRLVEAFEPLH